jgi:hypothetical protein
MGLVFYQNKAGQYLGHYLRGHFNHLRGRGSLCIQLESRDEAFDAFKEARDEVIAFAI